MANDFALAAKDRSQWHHGHDAQAYAARSSNGFAQAANDLSQCHHGHGAQALPGDRASLRARGWEPRHFETILSINWART